MNNLDKEFTALAKNMLPAMTGLTADLHLQAMGMECVAIFERLADVHYGHLATLGYTPKIASLSSELHSIRTVAIEFKVPGTGDYKPFVTFLAMPTISGDVDLKIRLFSQEETIFLTKFITHERTLSDASWRMAIDRLHANVTPVLPKKYQLLQEVTAEAAEKPTIRTYGDAELILVPKVA